MVDKMKKRRRRKNNKRLKSERMNSGNLLGKITNILQERNSKTEVIRWKKSVTQTV